MSQLEDAAKPLLTPMISGRRVTLDKPEQRTLATWAFKTAIIGERLNPRTAVIPEVQRASLRAEGEPPSVVSVYIAATDARWPGDTHYSDKKMVVNEQTRARLPDEAVSGDGFVGYAATVAIRHVALQVVGVFSDLTVFEHQPPTSHSVERIWPFQRSFRWPTGPILDTAGLGLLIDQFRGDSPPTPPF
jgi:hypothetical protein